jgi:hypothetical protein
MYKIGDKVVLLNDMYQAPGEDSPGGCLAKRGDVLVVRKADANNFFPLHVAHESVTDGSAFGVCYHEVEKQ